MTTIEQTPENEPLFDALIRIGAANWPQRDLDAEDVMAEAILELVKLRAENTSLCVAATAVLYPTTAGIFHCYHCCAYVLDATDHAPDCPFTTLRELVEQDGETTR